MAAIQLLKVWMNHLPPCVLRDVPDGLASLMIARKIGKIVENAEADKKESKESSKKRKQ